MAPTVRSFALAFLFLALVVGCTEAPRSVYVPGVERELTREDRVDTLLGGLTFGMDKHAFYTHCLAANARGAMTDGLDNMIRVDVPGATDASAPIVEFFPTFEKGAGIATLPGRYYSLAWSPWNRGLFADSLVDDALRYLEGELGGNPFDSVAGAAVTTFVKLDANRRVTVRPSEGQFVRFDIVDLTGAPDSIRLGRDLLVRPMVYSPITQNYVREL